MRKVSLSEAQALRIPFIWERLVSREGRTKYIAEPRSATGIMPGTRSE